jgi:hypothetical protein
MLDNLRIGKRAFPSTALQQQECYEPDQTGTLMTNFPSCFVWKCDRNREDTYFRAKFVVEISHEKWLFVKIALRFLCSLCLSVVVEEISLHSQCLFVEIA